MSGGGLATTQRGFADPRFQGGVRVIHQGPSRDGRDGGDEV